MNLFVRATRNPSITTLAALTAGSGVLALICLAGPAAAQDANVRLGEPRSQIVVAQRSQRSAASSLIKEAAGRYAVLREDGKDTLCMVTLFTTPRGRGYYRAQLAPACRDNGIVVFDPTAWSIDGKGRLSLQARKGHKMVLEKDETGAWQRADAPKARPLGLRRI